MWRSLRIPLLLGLLLAVGLHSDLLSGGRVFALDEPDSSDSVPPTSPGTPTLQSRSPSSLTLSWSGSSDEGGSGLAGYDIYRNSILIGSSSSTAFRDTELSAATSYTYTIAAYDDDDNTSDPTAQFSAKTMKKGDANGDDKVDAIDLNRLATNWAKTGATLAQGDFNEDGKIDAIDLNIIATNWNK